MFSSKKIVITIIFILFALVHYSMAGAQTIAVFPVEDLSVGVNSPNMELTRNIAGEMEARGLHVIRESDIISFMAAQRFRWLGYLSTEDVLATRNALGADLILFGTICQRQEKRSPSYGLSLYMVRTKDAKTIWSASGGLSLVDLQRLLGINQPKSIEELWPVLVRNVLATWPSDLSQVMDEPLVFNLEEGEKSPVMQIKAVHLAPRYVRPGEVVKCIVELDNALLTGDERPQVFIRAGNRVHLAQQTPKELYYEASWTGSEIEKGIFREVGHEAIYLAAADLSPQLFEGLLTGTEEDDVYPVNLILRWPTGDKQIAYVGNYTVDSKPPDVDFVLKGKEIDGIVSFRNKVLAMPTYKVREPISHWKISVENDRGKTIIADEGEGMLPRSFFWKGQYFNGFPAEDGMYRMILDTWDRAGNQATIAKDVAYRPNPPEVYIEVTKMDQALKLKLIQDDFLVPLAYWQLEIWTAEGELLQSDNGENLPVEYEIPFVEGETAPKIEGVVLLRDILGNQTHLAIEDLNLLALKITDDNENTSEAEKSSEPEDDDSWAWLTKF